MQTVIDALEGYKMKERIITGVLLAITLVPALFLGGIFLDIIVGLVVLIGSYEIVNLFSNKWPKYTKLLFPLCSLLLAVTAIWANPKFLLPMFVLFILLCVTLVVVDEKFEISDVSVMVFFHIILLFVLLCYQLVLQNNITHFFIIFIICVSCFTDIGAYFIGYLFGKHKLNERISPKKTIEGSIGGCVIGTTSGIIYSILLLPGFDIVNIAILSFIMTIVGQIGDLIFSAIKRHYGIKDYGHLFPGHGGVLDRTDSILLNVVFAYAFLLAVLV